jgi:SAM-dependent methyltransferase
MRSRRQDQPLAGTGLLQSEAEWAVRGEALVQGLAGLIQRSAPTSAARGIDVGCQRGGLIDGLAALTSLEWVGIDPVLSEPSTTPGGRAIGPGIAHEIDYPDQSFDVVVLANVFEHILPAERVRSFTEIRRVLRPDGVIVGQIPNPYFPIESHSRLPFMGFLPMKLQKRYWSLSRVSWEHDFFVVTPRDLRRCAHASGFTVEFVARFNYPPEAIPARVRPVAKAAGPIMRVYPWAWQFILRRNPG